MTLTEESISTSTVSPTGMLMVEGNDAVHLTRNIVRVLGQEEGSALLALYLDNAEAHIRSAEDEVTVAILSLHQVRESGLYMFEYPSWTECLETFQVERGIGRSTMFKLLKVARIWEKLGREPEELLSLADGIRTVEPLLDGPVSPIRAYDRATGKVTAIKGSWEDSLPAGSTPAERLNKWIDTNVNPEQTAVVLRQSLYREAPETDRFTFMVCRENGVPTDVSWTFEPASDGKYSEGTGLASMPAHVFHRFCQRLGIPVDFR